jgi:hypothetical protein
LKTTEPVGEAVVVVEDVVVVVVGVVDEVGVVVVVVGVVDEVGVVVVVVDEGVVVVVVEPVVVLVLVLVVDGVGAVITAVGSEVATVDPFLLEALMITRTVSPTSAEDETYVCAVADGITEQEEPALLQRAHTYVKVVDGPSHDPGSAARLCPTAGVPVMDGSDVSTGARCPGAIAEWSLAALALDAATSTTTRANGQRRRRPIRPLSAVEKRSLVRPF